jgi:hypothetical protein
MAASVPRQECDFAAFEIAQDIRVRRFAEWSLLPKLLYIGKAGHRIQPAAANDANFRLRQKSPRTTRLISGIRIIQKRWQSVAVGDRPSPHRSYSAFEQLMLELLGGRLIQAFGNQHAVIFNIDHDWPFFGEPSVRARK